MGGYVRRQYPQWSWSFSRQQMFAACPRRYYYNYYLSHNGWESEAPQEAALAYRLKKLTNIYLVLGDAVHKSAAALVEKINRGQALPQAAQVEEEVRRQLRRVWISSRDQKDLFLKRPNRVEMLHEFYYGQGPSAAVVAQINSRVQETAGALVNSQLWPELRDGGAEIIACEQFDTFQIGNTPVYAVPDLLFRDLQNRWVIVDWKTGQASGDDREQIALYALYAHKKHGVPAQSLLGRLEYLNLESSRKLTFTAKDLQAVEEQARGSMAQMRTYLADSQRNVAKSQGHFPLTSRRSQCPGCNFYQLCQGELEQSAPSAKR